MTLVDEFWDMDGNSSKVYLDNQNFVVRFYNHKGEHMDASDFNSGDYELAIEVASNGMSKEK